MKTQGLTTTNRRKIRVLLAEDHALVREGLRTLLGGHGDIDLIGEASNGDEAMEMTQSHQPDVVLMDISLPGLDGLEATGEIFKKYPETKVIMLTMHEDEGHLRAALQAGACGYVVKSGASGQLLEAIRSVMNGKGFLHPAVTHHLMKNLAEKDRPAAPPKARGALTKREQEVLKLLADGHTNREIADMLYLSVKTVETHRERIMSKLNLRTRAALTRYVAEQGLP